MGFTDYTPRVGRGELCRARELPLPPKRHPILALVSRRGHLDRVRHRGRGFSRLHAGDAAQRKSTGSGHRQGSRSRSLGYSAGHQGPHVAAHLSPGRRTPQQLSHPVRPFRPTHQLAQRLYLRPTRGYPRRHLVIATDDDHCLVGGSSVHSGRTARSCRHRRGPQAGGSSATLPCRS